MVTRQCTQRSEQTWKETKSRNRRLETEGWRMLRILLLHVRSIVNRPVRVQQFNAVVARQCTQRSEQTWKETKSRNRRLETKGWRMLRILLLHVPSIDNRPVRSSNNSSPWPNAEVYLLYHREILIYIFYVFDIFIDTYFVSSWQ